MKFIFGFIFGLFFNLILKNIFMPSYGNPLEHWSNRKK